jgi:hypothetical protein
MLGYSFAKACALLVEHHPRASELVVDGCLGVMRGRGLFTLDPKRGGCGFGRAKRAWCLRTG